MLTNKEFMRQRAAKLNMDSSKKQIKKQKDYENGNILNTRFNELEDEWKYKNLISKYKAVFYLSIPLCLIVALFASCALIFLGVIKSNLMLGISVVIMFIFLYALVITGILKNRINKQQKTDERDILKAQLRAEIMKELEAEYELVKKI